MLYARRSRRQRITMEASAAQMGCIYDRPCAPSILPAGPSNEWLNYAPTWKEQNAYLESKDYGSQY